jgi:hypothetical protein
MTPSMTEVSGTWRTETPPTVEGSVVVDGSIPLVFFSPRACPGPVKTKLHTKHDIRGAEPIVSKDTHTVRGRDTRYETWSRRSSGVGSMPFLAANEGQGHRTAGLAEIEEIVSCKVKKGVNSHSTAAAVTISAKALSSPRPSDPLMRDHFRLKERNKVPAIEIWVVMNLLESSQRNAGLVAPHSGRPPDLQFRARRSTYEYNPPKNSR